MSSFRISMILPYILVGGVKHAKLGIYATIDQFYTQYFEERWSPSLTVNKINQI